MIFFFLFSFLLLTLDFVHSDRTSCRDSWVAYHSSCYLFAHDQLLTFTEAQHFCGQHSSHLVDVGDVHESNFLRQFVTHFQSSSWWIGLTDVLIEGEWQWIDTESNTKYLEWGRNEPSHSATEEDCAILARVHGFKWADVGCSLKFQPICEESVSPGNEIIG